MKNLSYYLRNFVVVRLHWWLRWLTAAVLYHSGAFRLLQRIFPSLSFRNRAVILRFHRILPDGERPLYNLGFPERAFEQLARFLAQNWHVVPLKEVVDRLEANKPFSPRTVVITFDDGYRDNYDLAAPVLKRHGLVATFFVTTRFIDLPHRAPWWDELAEGMERFSGESLALRMNGTVEWFPMRRRWQRLHALESIMEQMKGFSNSEFLLKMDQLRLQLGTSPEQEKRPEKRLMMNWKEVRELVQNRFEVECHTRSHPILANLAAREWSGELFWPRLRLERKLGKSVRFLAYPNGRSVDVTPELISKLRKYGYRAAVTSVGGSVYPGDNPFFLKRRGVYLQNALTPWGKFSPALFTLELSGFFDRLLHRKGSAHG